MEFEKILEKIDKQDYETKAEHNAYLETIKACFKENEHLKEYIAALEKELEIGPKVFRVFENHLNINILIEQTLCGAYGSPNDYTLVLSDKKCSLASYRLLITLTQEEGKTIQLYLMQKEKSNETKI